MLKYLVYLLMVYLCGASNNEVSEDALIQSIVNLKPYQTLIFVDNSTEDRIHKKISADIPTIVVDSGRLQWKNTLSAFPKSRKSTLLIIIQEKFEAEKAKFILDLYAELSFKYIRPKCLVITNDEVLPIDALQYFLHQGWSNKFLDLSIINLADNETTPRICNFNSFFNSTSIFSANTDLFPDKLEDMNGFNFTVPFLEFKPYLYLSTINDLTEYHGFEYIMFKIYAAKLNFTIKFETEEGYFLNSLNKVMNSELRMMLLPTYLTNTVYQSNLEFGEIQSFVHYRGLTLYKTRSIIEISFITLIPSMINLLVMFFATYLINCFIISKEQVGLFQKVQLLLGQTTNKVPKGASARIIFIFFSILSVYYMQDFTGKMAGALVASSRVVIESYQDLLKSKLPIYIAKEMIEILDNTDRDLDIVRSKIIEYEKPFYCEELLMKMEDIFCIIPESEGKFFIEKFRRPSGEEPIRLQQVLFSMMAEAYAYEPGSPFVEKFDQIKRIIIESGLDEYHKRMYHYVRRDIFSQDSHKYSSNEMAIFQVLMIYLTGCTVSFFILIVELLTVKIKKYLSK